MSEQKPFFILIMGFKHISLNL